MPSVDWATVDGRLSSLTRIHTGRRGAAMAFWRDRMSTAKDARRSALRYGSMLQLTGDYTRREIVEALEHLRFAGNGGQPLMIDRDVRDLLLAALGR
jgi:hypothetical protein